MKRTLWTLWTVWALFAPEASAFSIVSNATGTATLVGQARYRNVEYLHLNLVSDATGNFAATVDGFAGYLARFAYAPVAGDEPAAATSDLVIRDLAGVDVLSGLGTNLSHTTATSKGTWIAGNTNTFGPTMVYGDMDFVWSDADGAVAVDVWLYLETSALE